MEALHHALAVAGQDRRKLTLGDLKALISRWGPLTHLNRASPVYNATLLMEVCKVRGTRELMGRPNGPLDGFNMESFYGFIEVRHQ